MKVEFHCECQECEAISVFERDMRYPGNVPQIHLPFSVQDNSWKCKACGIVWHLEVECVNMSAEMEDEDLEGDMPLVEGVVNIGRVKAGNGGGLSIG